MTNAASSLFTSAAISFSHRLSSDGSICPESIPVTLAGTLMAKINKQGSQAYGMNLVLVDGDKYKDMIAGRMKKPNGRGSWMVFDGCDREYAEQVTAEHKVNVKSGNRTVQRWVPKRSHIDNHYLDAEVYALAAADISGVRTLHLQDEAEAKAKAERPEEAYAPEETWIKQNENWI